VFIIGPSLSSEKVKGCHPGVVAFSAFKARRCPDNYLYLQGKGDVHLSPSYNR